MHIYYVYLSNKKYETNKQIANNLKYIFYFRDYIKVLNKTYIDIYILYK